MKAVFITKDDTLTIQEAPVPELGPGDVLLENINTALWGSGSSIGRVLDFGDEMYDFNIGERVYPLFPSAGDGSDAPYGSLSEYMAVKDAIRNVTLFPIPETIPDKTATLIGPFLRGCHAARKGMTGRSVSDLYAILSEGKAYQGDIRYRSGQKTLVFGADACGLAAAVMLKWFGMDTVMVCDPSPLRLSIAEGLGMAVCNSSTEELSGKLLSVFGPSSSAGGKRAAIDCWIDMSEGQNALPLFRKYGSADSTYVCGAASLCGESSLLSSLPGEGTAAEAIPPAELALLDQSICGAGLPDGEDMSDVLSMMESGCFDLDQLFTAEYPLSELPEALEKAMDSGLSGTVLITF